MIYFKRLKNKFSTCYRISDFQFNFTENEKPNDLKPKEMTKFLD